MIYTIENEFLKANIDSKGAQLIELFDANGKNRMHIPNENTWKGISSILFPQVSRIRNDVYSVDGKEYEMKLHGFFRHTEIDVIAHNKTSIVFNMTDNEDTLKQYPYHFSFSVKYELDGNKINVYLKNINTGSSTLRYMVGGHPGFEIPFNKNEKYEDYFVKFEKKETSKALQVIDGYLAREYKQYLANEDVINLKHSLFVPDAICLENLESNYVDLLSKTSDYHLRFYFKGFDILAIWSLNKEEATYVCFEPWNGIPKQYVKEHEKMGVIELSPNEEKEFKYSIEIIK